MNISPLKNLMGRDHKEVVLLEKLGSECLCWPYKTRLFAYSILTGFTGNVGRRTRKQQL